jgi:hypothetical protein
MLIKILESLPRDFLLAEQLLLPPNMAKYAELVTTTIKAEGPSRMIGNAYLTLEMNYGSGAALGFLTTLQLLRRWAEECNKTTWLTLQYEAVNAMGKEVAGDYVISYLTNPFPEIDRISELLTTSSLLRGFITYGEVNWPGFSVGAYLLISLLLQAEQFRTIETRAE